MDHGRKIGGTEAPGLSMKKPKLPFVTVRDSPFEKDEPIVEDHRLVNWKRWLKIHEKQYRALDEGTGHQSKRYMVMNSCEKIRPQTEIRNLTEPTTVQSVAHKHAADLAFWKVPPILTNHGNPCLPDVSPVLTKKELMSIPTSEYVDIPNYIKKEKNLPNLPRKSASCPKPDTPKIADFVIIGGRRLGNEKNHADRIPTISIMDTSCENEDSEIDSERLMIDPGVVVSLKINDFQLTADERSIIKPSGSDFEEITCAVKFFTPVNQRSKKVIYFENRGNVAITYHWRNASHTTGIFPLSSRHDTSFFFNKNKALIPPGKKVDFPVWFHKSREGIFSESWRMEIHPKVFKATFLIHMWGYSASKYSNKVQLEIDEYLDRCTRNTAVRETIDEIICNAKLPTTPEPSYKSRYIERELFGEKNPSHFYHAGLVAQMYNLYKSATTPNNAASWTLSLIELRHILLQLKNPQPRDEMLTVFSDLCQQCLKPCLSNSIRNTKYRVVYSILCSLANRMEEESAFVKLNCIFTDQKSPVLAENISFSLDAPTKESIILIPGRKRSTKTSGSSGNSSLVPFSDVKPFLNDCTKITLYREVFYLRVYKLLVEAVEQATAAIDSLKNLNERES